LLPPSQQQLKNDCKKELTDKFGVYFNGLLTVTNMPISRFGSMLILKGLFDSHPIKVADHCFGCTAGQGSSCAGALN